MLLTIDVGNTNTVVGFYESKQLSRHFRLSSRQDRTSDEFGVLLAGMMQSADIPQTAIEAAIMASVVPPLNGVLHRMCEKRFGVAPLVVGPGVKTGMPVLVDNPREVGADRVVNAVAGYEKFCGDGAATGVIVVDFGTATTFDVVSPKGEYLGGAIAPGMQISTQALFQHAAKLPRVELEVPKICLGKNTVHSMQAGILYGYISLVDGVVERLRQDIDFSSRVVATGGVARVIAPHSKTIEAVDAFLTLDGLRLIYERNR